MFRDAVERGPQLKMNELPSKFVYWDAVTARVRREMGRFKFSLNQWRVVDWVLQRSFGCGRESWEVRSIESSLGALTRMDKKNLSVAVASLEACGILVVRATARGTDLRLNVDSTRWNVTAVMSGKQQAAILLSLDEFNGFRQAEMESISEPDLTTVMAREGVQGLAERVPPAVLVNCQRVGELPTKPGVSVGVLPTASRASKNIPRYSSDKKSIPKNNGEFSKISQGHGGTRPYRAAEVELKRWNWDRLEELFYKEPSELDSGKRGDGQGQGGLWRLRNKYYPKALDEAISGLKVEVEMGKHAKSSLGAWLTSRYYAAGGKDKWGGVGTTNSQHSNANEKGQP